MAARTLISLSSSWSLLGAPGVALVPLGLDSLSPDFLDSPGLCSPADTADSGAGSLNSPRKSAKSKIPRKICWKTRSKASTPLMSLKRVTLANQYSSSSCVGWANSMTLANLTLRSGVTGIPDLCSRCPNAAQICANGESFTGDPGQALLTSQFLVVTVFQYRSKGLLCSPGIKCAHPKKHCRIHPVNCFGHPWWLLHVESSNA